MTTPMVKVLTLALLAVALCFQSVDARERSQEAKDAFKYSHPCPSNGNNHGACPGYVIDHIHALACGGADSPENMQWQSVAEGKAKDKWERKGCASGRKAANDDTYGGYHSGKRGGCFTYSASGKIRINGVINGVRLD